MLDSSDQLQNPSRCHSLSIDEEVVDLHAILAVQIQTSMAIIQPLVHRHRSCRSDCLPAQRLGNDREAVGRICIPCLKDSSCCEWLICRVEEHRPFENFQDRNRSLP